MKNKLDKLKNTFSNNFNGNYNQSNGIGFVIKKMKLKLKIIKEEIIYDVNTVNNTNFIYFNKYKPEIIFKDEDNQEVLNPKHNL